MIYQTKNEQHRCSYSELKDQTTLLSFQKRRYFMNWCLVNTDKDTSALPSFHCPPRCGAIMDMTMPLGEFVIKLTNSDMTLALG